MGKQDISSADETQVDVVTAAAESDNVSVETKKPAKKSASKQATISTDADASSVEPATAAADSANDVDANDAKKAQAAEEKKAQAAAKKALAAEKKAIEAEKKLQEAERKAREAEEIAAEAERKAATVEIELSLIKKKQSEKAAEAAVSVVAATDAADEIEIAEPKAEVLAEEPVAAEVSEDKKVDSKPQADEAADAQPKSKAVVWRASDAAKAPAPSARSAPKKPVVAEKPVEKKPLVQKVVRKNLPDENLTMDELMSSSKKESGYFAYKSGKKVLVTVISAGDSGISVAMPGGKKDGFIDKSEVNIDGSYDSAQFAQGDEINAVIIENSSKGATYINLSKKQIDLVKEADKVHERILQGEEFELVCDKVVKGGITGKLGSYTVFVPASQIKSGYVKNLEDYLGKKLRLTALPPKSEFKKQADVTEDDEKVAAEDEDKDEYINTADDVDDAAYEEEIDTMDAAENADAKKLDKKRKPKSSKFIVASQRVILEREQREVEDKAWGVLRVGDIVIGRVKRFATFGAFVNVGGVDCLVHVSDLSWGRANDPSKILDANKEYEFIVLKADREQNKVSLGYKQLQKKPYDLAYEKYPVGTVVTGVVERIKEFGAFISIDEGVDGLVHVSNIAHEWVRNANEVLKVGETVTAKVISFEDDKITLSIKDLIEKPEVQAFDPYEYETGDVDEPRESGADRFKKRVAKKSADGESSDKRDGATSDRPRRDQSRRPRREGEGEQSEWLSGAATTSLGDLFKDLKLDE